MGHAWSGLMSHPGVMVIREVFEESPLGLPSSRRWVSL